MQKLEQLINAKIMPLAEKMELLLLQSLETSQYLGGQII